MIGLYLLAAHMFGDFVMQNRWQAVEKFTSRRVRRQHVAWYLVPFIPLLTWQAASHNATRAGIALVWITVAHYATDSRRFYSTLGDVMQWRYDAHVAPEEVRHVWLDYLRDQALAGGSAQTFDINDETIRWPTPNPWPPMPILIDQALHICQIAIAGAILVA